MQEVWGGVSLNQLLWGLINAPQVEGRVELQCICNRASAHRLGVLELEMAFQRRSSQSLAVAALQGGQNLG